MPVLRRSLAVHGLLAVLHVPRCRPSLGLDEIGFDGLTHTLSRDMQQLRPLTNHGRSSLAERQVQATIWVGLIGQS